MYPATLVKVILRSKGLVEFLGLFKYRIISSANMEFLTSFFLICSHLITTHVYTILQSNSKPLFSLSYLPSVVYFKPVSLFYFHTCAESTLIIITHCTLSFHPSHSCWFPTPKRPHITFLSFIFKLLHMKENMWHFFLSLNTMISISTHWHNFSLHCDWTVFRGVHIPHFTYYFSGNGHLCWLHSLAIVNSAVITTSLQTFLFHCDLYSFGYIPRSEIVFYF
jgi:hypothetical protein